MQTQDSEAQEQREARASAEERESMEIVHEDTTHNMRESDEVPKLARQQGSSEDEGGPTRRRLAVVGNQRGKKKENQWSRWKQQMEEEVVGIP